MNAIHPLYIVSSIDYFKSFKMLDTEEAISVALLSVETAVLVVVVVVLELLEPERRLVKADVAADVAAEVAAAVTVSVVVSVSSERSTLFTRLVRPLITDVLFVLLTRLFEPVMSPAAKSL